jgi:hypothetical protein
VARERDEVQDAEALSAPEATPAPTGQTPGFRPGAPLGAIEALRLQRTVGNAAVTRLVAGQAAPARPPTPPVRMLQRDDRKPPYGVVPEMEEHDKTRQWWDPKEKARKPVWTPEGGYVKNPSATPLNDVVGTNGRVGKGFDNGTFTYVVDAKGDVIIAKRMGEPGGGPGRATGMPHPTLIGGKNPTVLAAGEVEIRGGKIYRIDNQSGHFQPGRKTMSTSLKGFLRLPKTAFHPDFHAQSVHYDAAGVRTTKPFRSIRMLKLKGRNFSQALKGLRPKAIMGKLKSGGFRAGAKGLAKGFAGLIAMLVLQYFLGKIMEKVVQDFIEKQIEELAPKIQEELEAHEYELEELLEEDSEAEIYVNVRLALETWTTPDPEVGATESLPGVKLHSVGYSRAPWDPTPTVTHETYCLSTVEQTLITHSEPLSPLDLFADPEAAVEEGAEQPAVK